MIDWSQCPDAESVPDRCRRRVGCQGQPGAPVQAIIDNAQSPRGKRDLGRCKR